MSIAVAQSLIPNTAGVPLDGRTVCANAAALANIENPYIGMRVWLNDPGKEVIVKTLTAQTVGAFTKNVIGTTEDAPTRAEITALQGNGNGGGISITTLQLVKPQDGLHLLIKKAGSDGTLANATTLIDTATVAADRSKVKAFLASGSDGSFQTCPADGFGSPYDGAAVTVDLSELTSLPAILFYCWKGESSSMGDFQALSFPCCGGGGSTGVVNNTNSLRVEVVSALPATPVSTTLYLIPEV